MTTFHKLQNINENTRDIVFGYNRKQSEKWLDNQPIPQLINHLILMYYYIYGKLDLSLVNEEHLEFKCGNTLIWKKEYCQIKLPILQKSTHWNFKINTLCEEIVDKHIMIGIHQDIENEDYYQRQELKYGFDFLQGRKIELWTISSEWENSIEWGRKCKVGDIITMSLDCKHWVLKFRINHIDCGVAFYIESGKYSVILSGNKRLSITMN